MLFIFIIVIASEKEEKWKDYPSFHSDCKWGGVEMERLSWLS